MRTSTIFQMLLRPLCSGLGLAKSPLGSQFRGFFGWFDAAFNKYDAARIEEVDRRVTYLKSS